eukprot:m.121502 g.121502  ORF g.121502 m.121502 type:complete len:868 (-) comp14399_c0_seq4:356-2959(-)
MHLLIFLLSVTPLAQVEAMSSQDPVDNVYAMLTRVMKSDATKYFDLVLEPAEGLGTAQVANEPSGKLGIKATSINAMTYAAGVYLREYCHASLTWVKTGGLNSTSRCFSMTGNDTLPKIENPLTLTRRMNWTYYQNVVDSSYSFVWWDFARWEVEVDWMSLVGINLALMYNGQEAVLLRTYKKFGIDLTNASGDNDFFNGPAFLSWSRGQGQGGVGGRDSFPPNGNGGALPMWFIQGQEKLGQQIATRMRSLGINTILRGFEGNVPLQLKTLYPKANISGSGTNYLLDALDPLFTNLSDTYMQDLVATFGTDHFYQADGFFSHKSGPWASSANEIDSINGEACQYSAVINMTYIKGCTTGSNRCEEYNTLAEAQAKCDKEMNCGGITLQRGTYQTRSARETTPSPSNEPSVSWLITNDCHGPPPPPPSPPQPDHDAFLHSQAAYHGLTRTDPQAVWVYQTWIWRGFNEDKLSFLLGWLEAVPPSKHLLLDQTAEYIPLWSRFNNWTFGGHPFVWCAMLDMGGGVGMFGDIELVAEGSQSAFTLPNSSMAGVGIDPEGIDQNPVYYTKLFDSAWTPTDNTSTYLQKWSTQRCGKESDNAAQAWALLGNTVYKHDNAQTFEHHMKYCPTTMPGGSGWDKPMYRPSWYNYSDLHKAWGLLIDSTKDCDVDDGFIFDLVDVGREYLSVAPCTARYDALVAATTTPAILNASNAMTELMEDLDTLLQTSGGFLLGHWISQARALAKNSGGEDDADFIEWNARSQVTSWFPLFNCNSSSSSLPGLWDYGNKAWSGLVGPFYNKRYQIYAQEKMNLNPDDPSFQQKLQDATISKTVQMACNFARIKWDGVNPPATPLGDPVAISQQMWQKYAPV